jgi:hypothetical protein
MCDSSDESTDWPLSSAITSWNRGTGIGYASPFRKHSTMSSPTPPSPEILVNTARLSPDRPEQKRGVFTGNRTAGVWIDLHHSPDDHGSKPPRT